MLPKKLQNRGHNNLSRACDTIGYGKKTQRKSKFYYLLHLSSILWFSFICSFLHLQVASYIPFLAYKMIHPECKNWLQILTSEMTNPEGKNNIPEKVQQVTWRCRKQQPFVISLLNYFSDCKVLGLLNEHTHAHLSFSLST